MYADPCTITHFAKDTSASSGKNNMSSISVAVMTWVHTWLVKKYLSWRRYWRANLANTMSLFLSRIWCCLGNRWDMLLALLVFWCSGGNALLVGVGSSGEQSLSKLPAFICHYETCQISVTKRLQYQRPQGTFAWIVSQSCNETGWTTCVSAH